MAQHGYLREYDEGWDRDDDRERGEAREHDDWRNRDRQQRSSSDRDHQRDWDDRGRDRGFMFDDQDRDRSRGAGFFSRPAGDDRARYGDDDRERSERGAWENNGDWPQRNRGMSGSESYGSGRQQEISNHPDDHYRSWRDKQMESLDRDYADYCRECEQQFHRDFDNWRQTRQQNRGPEQQQEQQQSQQQGGGREEEELVLSSRSELTGSTAPADEQSSTPSPEGEATLGSNNPANAGPGRGGRR